MRPAEFSAWVFAATVAEAICVIGCFTKPWMSHILQLFIYLFFIWIIELFGLMSKQRGGLVNVEISPIY